MKYMRDLKKLEFECSFKAWLFSEITRNIDVLMDAYGMDRLKAEKYLSDIFEDTSISIINTLNSEDKNDK